MTLGHNERVPWGNRIFVVERYTGLRLADNIHISAQRAEWTLGIGRFLYQRIIGIH